MKPGQPVSHNDACVLLRAVQRKLQQSLTLRPMPRVRLRSARDGDRVKAAQMIAAEIVASVARCEDLERQS